MRISSVMLDLSLLLSVDEEEEEEEGRLPRLTPFEKQKVEVFASISFPMLNNYCKKVR